MLWCAEQVALGVATSLEGRQQADRLIDSDLIGLGDKQRYGTLTKVVGRTVRPLSLEDATQVDAQRAAAGLPPLAQEADRLAAERAEEVRLAQHADTANDLQEG